MHAEDLLKPDPIEDDADLRNDYYSSMDLKRSKSNSLATDVMIVVLAVYGGYCLLAAGWHWIVGR